MDLTAYIHAMSHETYSSDSSTSSFFSILLRDSSPFRLPSPSRRSRATRNQLNPMFEVTHIRKSVALDNATSGKALNVISNIYLIAEASQGTRLPSMIT